MAGPPAAATVAPRDEAAVVASIRSAQAEGWVVVARGAGSRDRWGGPVARGPVIVLDTRALSGICAHEPGDLTIRVFPGTTLQWLSSALAPHGQVLSWVPPRAARATIGGMVSADAWGPTRLAHGGPRDLVLGLRAVDGAGRAFAAGGHVVKNVSGLDIGKLFVGSFGSLGVLCEVSLKLRPAPRREAYWAASFAAPAAAWSAVRRILDGDFQPAGVTLGERQDAAWLTVCVQGGDADVEDQLARLTAAAGGGLIQSAEGAEAVWTADREVEPDAEGATAVRCEVAEAELEPLARELASVPLPLRRVAWPGLGTLWCVLDGSGAQGLPPAESLALVRRLREAAEARGGRAVVAACPPEVRSAAEPFGDPGELLPWYQSLKRRFDPDGILAPGRFVGGL